MWEQVRQMNLSVVLADEDRLEEALAALRLATRIRPRDPLALSNLGTVCLPFPPAREKASFRPSSKGVPQVIQCRAQCLSIDRF